VPITIEGIEDIDFIDLIDFVDFVERTDDVDGVRLRDDFVGVGVKLVKFVGIVGGNPCNCDCDIDNPGL